MELIFSSKLSPGSALGAMASAAGSTSDHEDDSMMSEYDDSALVDAVVDELVNFHSKRPRYRCDRTDSLCLPILSVETMMIIFVCSPHSVPETCPLGWGCAALSTYALNNTNVWGVRK